MVNLDIVWSCNYFSIFGFGERFVLCIQRSFGPHLCYFKFSLFTPHIKPTSRLRTHFLLPFSYFPLFFFHSFLVTFFIPSFSLLFTPPLYFFIRRTRVPLTSLLPENPRSRSSVRLTLHVHITNRSQAISWLFWEIPVNAKIRAGPQSAPQTPVQEQLWTEF